MSLADDLENLDLCAMPDSRLDRERNEIAARVRALESTLAERDDKLAGLEPLIGTLLSSLFGGPERQKAVGTGRAICDAIARVYALRETCKDVAKLAESARALVNR